MSEAETSPWVSGPWVAWEGEGEGEEEWEGEDEEEAAAGDSAVAFRMHSLASETDGSSKHDSRLNSASLLLREALSDTCTWSLFVHVPVSAVSEAEEEECF